MRLFVFSFVLVLVSSISFARSPHHKRHSESILPPEAKAVMEEHERKLKELQSATAAKLSPLLKKAIAAEELDAAVAIRALLVEFGAVAQPISHWPAHIQVGKKYLLQVPMAQPSSTMVWGTDVYTTDSNPHLAAIHMGLMKPGESGSLEIEILAGQESYVGSNRNGVDSKPYGQYGASMKIRKVK